MHKEYTFHKCPLSDKIINKAIIRTVLILRGSRKIFRSNEGAVSYIEALTSHKKESKTDGKILFHKTPYRIIGNANAEKKVLYFHGGAFVRPLTSSHIKMLKYLSKRSGVDFIVPEYLLAPEHRWSESTLELCELYEDLLSKAKNCSFIFMGDSSGAAICVTLLEQLKLYGLPMPEKLILLSPLLSLDSGKNVCAKNFSKCDPMFGGTDGLTYCIDKWLSGTDKESPYVDPMKADFSVLPETHIITGKSDMLHFDAIEFYRKAKKHGAKITLDLFDGMYHAFPLYPLKSSKKVKNMVLNMITS